MPVPPIVSRAEVEAARQAMARRKMSHDPRREHDERLKILTDEIARRRRAPNRITRDRLMNDLDPETERSLQAAGAQIGREIAPLKRDLEGLRASRPLGPVAGQAEALLGFARDVARGFKHATPAERRRLYGMFRLEIVVTPDPTASASACAAATSSRPASSTSGRCPSSEATTASRSA